jgi:hypothetical protein
MRLAVQDAEIDRQDNQDKGDETDPGPQLGIDGRGSGEGMKMTAPGERVRPVSRIL